MALTTPNSVRLGLLVKRARQHAGMTQIELAKASGLAQQTISHLERGVTSRSAYVDRIAEAPGLSVEELTAGSQVAPDQGVRSIPCWGRGCEAQDWPMAIVEQTRAAPGDLVCLRAADELAGAGIPARSWMLVDTSDCYPLRDGIYLLDLGGAPAVRQVSLRLGGGATVGGEPVPSAELPQLPVVGRVVWVSRPA